jgi:ubiquinone/menaquinone biosynthesis C-methylase UbiE
VLDVGAGTGRLALSLAEQGAAVSALDISYEMLEVLKRKINGKFSVDLVVADAEALPFSENSFDVVVATFLIVHLKDPFIFFDEVYRVLKPGGLFLLTNINQKEPPHIESNEGLIKITSYYHRPEKIINHLEALAFSIRENAFLKEGEVWINQFIIAEK